MKVDEAGPQLNQLVDEHLMRFECYRKQNGLCDGNHKTRCGACGGMGHGNCYGDGRGPVQIECCTERPDYSGDIAAAWQVVDKMKEDGLQLILYSNPPGTYARPASAEFGRIGRGHIGRATGDSDAHAICLAALDALRNAGEVKDRV